MEDFDGRPPHAIAALPRPGAATAGSTSPRMLTHRFGLEEWWPALKALARQDQSGALKVAFTPNA